mmetsp:Transcript_25127/g.51909  ORF Transcript_25127/g.51909 Transcript_25127/m.51909 type:complete len:116 (-) Transcript_25127:15-362(-)
MSGFDVLKDGGEGGLDFRPDGEVDGGLRKEVIHDERVFMIGDVARKSSLDIPGWLPRTSKAEEEMGSTVVGSSHGRYLYFTAGCEWREDGGVRDVGYRSFLFLLSGVHCWLLIDL